MLRSWLKKRRSRNVGNSRRCHTACLQNSSLFHANWPCQRTRLLPQPIMWVLHFLRMCTTYAPNGRRITEFVYRCPNSSFEGPGTPLTGREDRLRGRDTADNSIEAFAMTHQGGGGGGGLVEVRGLLWGHRQFTGVWNIPTRSSGSLQTTLTHRSVMRQCDVGKLLPCVCEKMTRGRHNIRGCFSSAPV